MILGDSVEGRLPFSLSGLYRRGWTQFATDIALTGNGMDRITGGDGPDLLIGGDGDDYLDGRDGLNFIVGDTLFADPSQNAPQVSWLQAAVDPISMLLQFGGVPGAGGNDTIMGGKSSDMVLAGQGNDTVRGQDHWDWLLGNDGADKLYGGDGTDRLYGGDQSDWLTGDDGLDTLRGGADGDRFYLDSEYWEEELEDSDFDAGEGDQQFVALSVSMSENAEIDVSMQDLIPGSVSLRSMTYDRDNTSISPVTATSQRTSQRDCVRRGDRLRLPGRWRNGHGPHPVRGTRRRRDSAKHADCDRHRRERCAGWFRRHGTLPPTRA